MTVRHLRRTSASLKLGRDRDAFPTIRGFVYQVELTILRWLDLGEQEALELERGEDIDRITQQLVRASPDTWDRHLEQVKHRATAITMRSPGLRAALANFFEHRSLNPGLSLRFRFTTNARATRERPSPLPNRLAGIDAWQRLHAGEAPTEEVVTLLAGFRTLFRGAPRPNDVAEESWKAWQTFFDSSSDRELVAFIAQVEIATGSPEPEALRPEIERQICDQGHAADSEAAADLYKHLFASVFKRLSLPELKRLTRADLLAEVDGVGPGARDRVLGPKLEKLREMVDERFGAVEQGLSAVRTDVARLSAEVAAHKAPPGVHHGDTRTFQTTTNYFGRELEPSSTFNHARHIAGRGEESRRVFDACRSALADGSGVVVLGGPGGVGKSRLLLETARRLEDNGGLTVRWLRDSANPDIESLNELPEGPALIFCDDAHRRTDLEIVLALIESRRYATAVVLGVRPRGRDALRIAAFQAGIGLDRISDLGDLSDLDPDDLLQLVASELGPDDEYWSEAVVRAARGSTLVSLVAARLLRTRRLNPGILSQDPEVHHVVFAGFEHEIYGRVGPDAEPALAKRVLELFAAIGPVPMDDEDLIERAAAFAGTDAPTLRRAVGTLQEAGVLREERQGVRIIPDILSDHVLHRTLVAAGRPTRAECKVVEELGPGVLPNLVRNVAELDWQLVVAGTHNGAGTRPDIFSDVWSQFLQLFHDSSTYERSRYLERLRPVAAFQPSRMLDLCDSVVQNPSGEDRTQLDRAFTPGSVLAKIPSLLAIIAQHENYYERVLDLLWRLGRDDRRELNAHPEHAIRVLQEVVGYAPLRYLWRQDGAVRVFRRWTQENGWSGHAQSPLVVAHAILRTAMIQDRFDPRTNALTMTRYGVNADMTRAFREEVIRLLSELTLGPEPRGRIWAAEALLKALDPPESQFGHIVTDDEEEAFRAQYEAAFQAVERVATSSADLLVRIKLRDGLQWVIRQTPLAWKKKRARELVKRFRETKEIQFARVWGGMFRNTFTPWQLAHRHAEQLTVRTAERLLSRADGAEDVLERLVVERERFEAAGLPSEPGYLLAVIAERRPDLAAEVASRIIHAPEAEPEAAFAGWLHVLLIALRRLRPGEYARLLLSAATSVRSDLRRASAWALRWAHTERPWGEDERVHLHALLGDANASVREAAVAAVYRAPVGERAAFLRSSQVLGSETVASAIVQLWAYRPQAEHPRLSSADTRRLLDMFVDLPDVGQQRMHIDEMLGSVARSEPLLVLDFIIERVRREVASYMLVEGDEWRHYDAVPYSGFPSVQGALQGSPDHPAIVRRLLTAIVEEARAEPEVWRRQVVEVARSVMWWDEEIEEAIREWIGEGREEDIAALEQFFSTQQPLFVLQHREFIAELLQWLAVGNGRARQKIKDALRTSSEGRTRVRHIGTPDEIDVRLSVESQAYAAELDARGDEYRAPATFYSALAVDAEERLAADHQHRTSERGLPEELGWNEEE